MNLKQKLLCKGSTLQKDINPFSYRDQALAKFSILVILLNLYQLHKTSKTRRYEVIVLYKTFPSNVFYYTSTHKTFIEINCKMSIEFLQICYHSTFYKHFVI